MSLESVAETMLQSQSFKYSSFEEAKDTIEFEINGIPKYITYDRLSFFFYKHNLTPSEYHDIGELLKVWLTRRDKEECKKRREYLVLIQYAIQNVKFLSAKIIKSERPDFTLELDGGIIGAEITQFVTEDDSVMRRILTQYENRGLKANEILGMIKLRHGKKAQKYAIEDLPDDALMIYNQDSYLLSNDEFISNACRKSEKYREIADTFDDFLLICDATYGINITSEREAIWLIEDIRSKICVSKMRLVIIYEDSSGNLMYKEEI